MKSMLSNALVPMLIAAALCFAGVASAAVCPTQKASCPANTVCAAWAVPTTRESGAPLPANEIKGYELYLDNVLVTSPTTNGYNHAVPTDQRITTSSIWSILTVDTDGVKSSKPNACTQPVVIAGPKSAPAAPAFVAGG
jgi:hypothetical protein